MNMPFQKYICPNCEKLSLVKWPAAGNTSGRDVCGTPGCGYKKLH